MRRLVVLALSTLLVVAGCGKQYVARMDKTIEDLKYQERLNANLEPGPGDGDLKKLSIWVRAPKGQQQTKAFALGNVPEGQFDVASSYSATGGASLHVLARKKMPKAAPKKGAVPAPDIPRGPFLQDVMNILTAQFGPVDALAPEKSKPETKKGNTFKRWVFPAADKTVQLYTFEKDPFNVALIYVFDTKNQNEMASKVGLSLEAFATGPKADRFFGGATSEEEASESVATPL